MEPFRDLLSYRLAETGFDMFEEMEEGLKAYAPLRQYEKEKVQEVINESRVLGCEISVNEIHLPWKNWNEEWEKNFQAEIIGDSIYVRAEFHPSNPGFPYEILIQPRMAFGTGHHPTTAQVMEMMLTMEFKGKKVIDMGCGTGILAILARQLGAESVLAIDNDIHAVENSRDNILINRITGIHVLEGDGNTLKDKTCDIFIANINRNIIINDLSLYRNTMKQGGELITSGYLINDLPLIQKHASKAGFEYLNHTVNRDWCCAHFVLKDDSPAC